MEKSWILGRGIDLGAVWIFGTFVILMYSRDALIPPPGARIKKKILIPIYTKTDETSPLAVNL